MSMANVSIRHLVLGLLAQQPMSGYDIKRYLNSLKWLVDSPSFGSLYPTLRQLLRDGLVSVDIVLRADKPACKIYQITNEGESTLQRWLDQPVAPDASLKTFIKRLVLASNLSGARLMADLEQRREQVSSHRVLLEGLAASLDEGCDPKRKLAIEYGLAMAGAEAAWLDATVERLSQEPLLASEGLARPVAQPVAQTAGVGGGGARRTPRRQA